MSFHSAVHACHSSQHWWRKRQWFLVKDKRSNGRLVDIPLCCKRRRMRDSSLPCAQSTGHHGQWCSEVDAISPVGPLFPPAFSDYRSASQLFDFVQHVNRFL
ncbi:hypothetical protein TNCV_4131911 [Trichonephila clavipes]|nr:hypothetical protein TNCV_4131911 [Trichonephila clavipes]